MLLHQQQIPCRQTAVIAHLWQNCHSVRRIFFGFYELTELTPHFPQLDEILETKFYAYYRQ